MSEIKLNKKIKRIAKRIITKNLALKKGETLIISCGKPSLEFAEEIAYNARMLGAHPLILYSSDNLEYRVYKDIKEKFLKDIPKISTFFAKNIEAFIHIDDGNPFIERKLPQKKVEVRRKAFLPIKKIYDKRIIKKNIKKALLGFPTKEKAKGIGIKYEKLSSIFWNTLDYDYVKIYEFNKKIINLLKNKNKIEIFGKNTEFSFSIKNRVLHNACGLWEKENTGFLNLPDGEVFCAPIEKSANGEIYFDLQCMWHYGKKVKGVWFKFKNGKIVDYSIEEGEKDFEEVMKNASGKKEYIAEFGIGTNPKAKITGGLTIVDEKVLGTIHIAIGNNISFGGKNESTIHWDFFKDMKKGEIYADKKLVMKNGKWLI